MNRKDDLSGDSLSPLESGAVEVFRAANARLAAVLTGLTMTCCCREAHCSAAPAQIRTGSLAHSAPASGFVGVRPQAESLDSRSHILQEPLRVCRRCVATTQSSA